MANADQGADAKPAKDWKFIFTLVFAVINLGVVGGSIFLVYKSTIAWNAPLVTEEELATARKTASEHYDVDESPLIYTMDKFTVNLAGEPKKTVQVEINLLMLNREGLEEALELNRKSKIRDRIVTIFQERSFQDIEPIQGKLYLKDLITREANKIMKNGVVKNIYFSYFAAQ